MKRIPRFLSAAILTIVTVSQALAEPVGIRFDLMPVGCRVEGIYSDGKRVADVYLGVKNGFHLVRTYGGERGRNVIRTIAYDSEGRMVRKDWADGHWETFSPYSCFDLPGKCTYRYRNKFGDDKTYVGRITRTGGGLVSKGGFKGEAAFSPTTLKMGPFNASVSYSDGQSSWRVTGYKDCGSVAGG